MERGYAAKIIRWNGQSLVNICDLELLGKTVQGNGVNMKISEDYFNGRVINIQEALELVKNSYIANLVGDRIIQRTLEAKLASGQAVKRMGSVPFLMIFKFTRL